MAWMVARTKKRCASPQRSKVVHVSFIRLHKSFVFLNFIWNLFQVCVCFINLCSKLISVLELHVKNSPVCN